MLSLPLYALGLLLMVLAWVFTRLKPPFEIPASPNTPKRSTLPTILVVTWMLAMVIAGLEALRAQPDLSKNDVRLGLILAGAWTLFGLGLRLNRSAPGLEELRALRTKLAFGAIDPTGARQEANTILFGSPQEQYFLKKAQQVLFELRACIQVSTRETARIQRWAELSDIRAVLLVPQRVDRVQARGFAGGVEAEEDPHSGAEKERVDDPLRED